MESIFKLSEDQVLAIITAFVCFFLAGVGIYYTINNTSYWKRWQTIGAVGTAVLMAILGILTLINNLS